MDGNRDEAQRALKLAQSFQSTDPIRSLKFAKKACALYWSPEAAALVKTLETGEGPSTNSSNPTGSSSATKTSSTSPTKRSAQPSTPKPSSSNKNQDSNHNPPSYKPAQLELVKKVRKHKTTQYYEILELKRESDESQIKTAYRKLALALHPDKNNAPGADEAFKMVSKAFQVLSDPDKRAAFDRHGADPDSRSAGIPSSSAFGGGGGGMHFSHEDAIDPDQLFRMFFGGGGVDHPGMQFGGGPTVFQFGGGRTTFRRAGLNRRQQQDPNEPEVRTASTWISLLPIALFFLVSLLQSFPSLFSSPSTPDPSFSWNPSTVYPIQRSTQSSAGVTYFVNPVEFASHPIYEKYLKANPGLSGREGTNTPSNGEQMTEEATRLMVQDLINESRQLVEKRKANQRQYLVVPKEFQRFENEIEKSWVRKLQYECQNARAHREARRRELVGFLGIGTDWEAIKKLDAEIISACEGLRALGYVIDG